MKKYGLIGRNISHSKSPEVYQKLIKENFQYDLLDYASENDLPSLKDLMLKYNGINITAPYKKHYLQQVELTPHAKKIGAINCLAFKAGKAFGTNTDYLAFMKLLQQKPLSHFSEIIVLGSGAMEKMVTLVLDQLGLSYRTISRQSHGALEKFDFKNLEQEIGRPVLYVNCCAREFIFRSDLTQSSSFFWDMNYSNPEQHLFFQNKPEQYEDGLSLLIEQARFAVEFWSTI